MSKAKVYDVPEVLAALEAAVAEKGTDYIYENERGRKATTNGPNDCMYVHGRGTDNPTPGCIVGNVYHRLTGLLMPPEAEDVAARWALENMGFPAADEVLAILTRAQDTQDGGYTWSEALEAAREKAAL